MDQFSDNCVVWASARGDIFWPGEIVESGKDATLAPSRQTVNVHFFIEDSHEDIRNPAKIYPWNCEKQDKFIERGRALKNAERKVQFNKAVAKADSLVLMQRNKEGRSSLSVNIPPIKPTSRARKGANKKLDSTEETEAPVLRRSPRKITANGHSKESLALTTEKVTENKRSKVKCCPSSVKNNNRGRSGYSPVELDRASACKDIEVLINIDDCTARRSQSKNKVTVNSKREKSSNDDTNISTSVGKKRGRRKSSHGGMETLTSAEREGAISNGLSAQCSNRGLLSQRKCPPKRKLLDKGNESKKKKVALRNSKPSSHNSVDHSSGRTMHRSVSSNVSGKRMLANGHKDSEEMDEVGSSGESIVCESQGTVGVIGTGCFESSNHSSDDELMDEPFSPSQESNKFSVGDVVWAKYYREPYWPALVKKVTGKTKSEKKFIVRFLGWDDCLFKIQPKKLVHFACVPSQRAEFLRVKDTLHDRELEELFDEALSHAEDLLNRKGLGKSLDEEMNEEDPHIFEDKDDDDAQNKDLPLSSSTSLFECRRSLRTRKPVSKYRDILSHIRQAKPTLKQILNGTKPSERHTTFVTGRVSEKDNLKRRAGFGPIADENLREGIMDMLLEFYKELKGTADITYVSDVWLPEAIIWSISQIDHVDSQTAEKTLRDGCKYAVSSDEVRELTTKLKQRKLSAEEVEERLKQAERAIARQSAEN